ncbi:hypothetical protein [uncultured Bacteroides sp.]|uniref:hypothetical protein n=1 Tax=uncultured Bacteroides sp. TaxID=162156 RepID=UPI0025FE2621|nr:hypothetical protein [uncultured Bacteroides sp.]
MPAPPDGRKPCAGFHPAASDSWKAGFQTVPAVSAAPKPCAGFHPAASDTWKTGFQTVPALPDSRKAAFQLEIPFPDTSEARSQDYLQLSRLKGGVPRRGEGVSHKARVTLRL